MLRKNGFFLLLAAGFTLAACGGGSSGGTNGTTGGSGGEATGTAGSGGATGGTAGGATGGSGGNTGGTAGSGGNAGGTGGASTGGTGGSALGGTPQCTDDSQCQIVDDCCSCLAVGPGEPAPSCDIPECVVNTCQTLGKNDEKAYCVAGQCVAGLSCDPSKVACDSLPPDCPPGQTPTINGLCWGGCGFADECDSVLSCDQCTGDLTCVAEVAEGTVTHCVAPLEGCNGQATCDCMGGAVCTGIFTVCLDAPAGINCECPNCAAN